MNWKIWQSLNPRTKETRQEDPESVLTVVFRPGEDGYIVAECLQLPGCMSQGKTRQEANRNIRDAIKSVLMVRMGQILSEGAPHERHAGDQEEEESFRVKGPELVSC
jgi:predicted RNase H-like HicB family nuclease